MTRRQGMVISVLGWCAIIFGATSARADFFAFDLQIVFGNFQPVAVNENRQFTGTNDFPGDGTRAYRWQAGQGFTNLGVIGSGDQSNGIAINNGGAVAGNSRIGAGTNASTHAFLWREAIGMTDLGTLGGTNSNATAINSIGWVAGNSQTTGNTAQRAFLWRVDTGTMTDLGTLGGNNSTGRDVNTAGTVVGNSDASGGVQRPFMWTPSGGMVDIGGLSGPSSTGFAFGINELNMIVGRSERVDGTFGAFVWQSGAMTDLGTLGGENSTALAINNAGVIVGQAEDASGEKRAVVWDSTNGLRDLNDLLTIPIPGFTLTRAFDINDNGDILAVSERQDGTTVFLISGDPTPFVTSAIPAPAAGVLAILALPMLMWRHRKRRTHEHGDQSNA